MSVHAPSAPSFSPFWPQLKRLRNARKTTYLTLNSRRFLPPEARSLVLEEVERENGYRAWIHCAVVMPRQLQMLLTPRCEREMGPIVISDIIEAIAKPTSERVNREMHWHGQVWHREYLEQAVKDSEFEKYFDCICRNPERSELISGHEAYRWLWLEPGM